MKENIKMALASIFANKMRSLLTTLGIIIGTAAVIAILSIGNGATNTITGQLNNLMGTRIELRVNPSRAQSSDYVNGRDIEKIKELENVTYVSPRNQRGGNVMAGRNTMSAFIEAGTPDLQYTNETGSNDMMHGRFFTQAQHDSGAAVAVIDHAAAKELFYGRTDVVGETIQIGNSSTRQKAMIIGVVKNSVEQFMNVRIGDMEHNPTAFVFVPTGFAEKIWGRSVRADTTVVMLSDKADARAISNDVVNLLEQRHGNRGLSMYSARIVNMSDQFNRIMGLIIGFVAVVAAISLVVGGIGVMNIMLVSVTERTREIGIRKAIGATTGNVMLQFLTESTVLSLIGGLLGMTLGLSAAAVVGMFVGVTPSVTIPTVGLVVGYSLAIGIFFGAYPAKKASKLDPIEALRYD
ncbi:MAG: ABC transporter permease [Oscillospiraceae bacterium]|nr:ABC transporter permease [Oscillospiraceae bacterium]